MNSSDELEYKKYQRPIIQVSNLTKKVKNKTLVNKINFEIYPGEIVGFLGENGAGKTTTIRMLVGLTSPTRGSIKVCGFNIKTQFTRAIRNIGGIIESPELYKFLTGYQNLMHYARMTGLNEMRYTRRVREVIDLVDLNNAIHKKVKSYSLGMRQRLGLAQALIHKPALLILDEPTNGLDPKGIRDIRKHLQSLVAEDGISVLISSHLIAEIELMCDRILLMKKGNLIGEQLVNEKSDENAPILVSFTIELPQFISQDNLEKIINPYEFNLYNNRVDFNIPKIFIPDINKKFVEAGILVYEIKTRKKSLEDRFIEANEDTETTFY